MKSDRRDSIRLKDTTSSFLNNCSGNQVLSEGIEAKSALLHSPVHFDYTPLLHTSYSTSLKNPCLSGDSLYLHTYLTHLNQPAQHATYYVHHKYACRQRLWLDSLGDSRPTADPRTRPCHPQHLQALARPYRTSQTALVHLPLTVQQHPQTRSSRLRASH